MPIYKIRGIDVDFPFEAYDSQIVYMEKVIQSLQEGCNALLESPTGTGKTLCLLCATLAWRRTFGDFLTTTSEDYARQPGSQRSDSRFPGSQHSNSQPAERKQSGYPLIIYASRTHSQLKQVIRELKATNYRPKMTVLGSRKHMCIHNDVQSFQGRALDNACHYLCRKRLCVHLPRVSEYLKKDQAHGNEPFDIEDLVKIGRETKGPCPYYLSRELLKMIDILFVPYNYLIDPRNRRSIMGIQWNNAVLIFDEAHNLESICADAASFDLPSGFLTTCIAEAKKCIDLSIDRRAIEKSTDQKIGPDNYAILRALLLKLEKRIAEVVIQSKELGFTRLGHYIYDFLSDLNITFETSKMLMDTIEKALVLLEEGDTAENEKAAKTKGTVYRLESIMDFLKIIFRDGDKGHAKFYRFHVQESQPVMDPLKGKSSRTLSWWCFNPGLAMEEFMILGVRSIILTSGTLSPLDSFALELNLKFPVRLENPHVISPSQVWVGVVPSGPSGYSFNSSYRCRDYVEYKQELGNAIVNFARIVPDGLLVFFPSYYLMNQSIECWKNMGHASSTNFSTIWERICRNKQPVVEPKESVLFPNAIEDFQAKLRDNATSGAIFFAVCRGKLSEGLDFADHTGRAVVITGLPFSLRTDPKVCLKREYLDQQALSRRKDSKVLIGEEWYVQQAARAVNQAVGRVIRHRHDYGAIIFCDERFALQSYQSHMSYWLRPYVKCYPRFGDAVFTLSRFFRDQGPSGLVQPELPESVTVEKIESHQDNKLPSESITSSTSTAELLSRKSLASVASDTRDNTYYQLGPILPANRSTLSSKQSNYLASEYSINRFHIQNRLKTNAKGKKATQYMDDKLVDLTRNEPQSERQKTEDVLAHYSVKKPKLSDIVGNNESGASILQHLDDEVIDLTRDVSNSECHNTEEVFASFSVKKPELFKTGNIVGNFENTAYVGRLCDVNSTQTPSTSGTAVANCVNTLRLSLLGSAEVGGSNIARAQDTRHSNVGSAMMSKLGVSTEKIDSEQQLRNNEDAQSSSLPHSDEGTRGSAFLSQVQEKLTVAEYKEFVGLMKALKSKTMKISHVLESISSLFSLPGRFSLLRRFKDFIPTKYRPIYEQHLAVHDETNDTPY